MGTSRVLRSLLRENVTRTTKDHCPVLCLMRTWIYELGSSTVVTKFNIPICRTNSSQGK